MIQPRPNRGQRFSVKARIPSRNRLGKRDHALRSSRQGVEEISGPVLSEVRELGKVHELLPNLDRFGRFAARRRPVFRPTSAHFFEKKTFIFNNLRRWKMGSSPVRPAIFRNQFSNRENDEPFFVTARRISPPP